MLLNSYRFAPAVSGSSGLVLRLPYDGVNGSSNFANADQSVNSLSPTTSVGGTISTTLSRFGGAFSSPSGGYQFYTHPSLAPGSNAFTFQCWVRTSNPSAGTQRGFFQLFTAGGGFSTSNTAAIAAFASSSTTMGLYLNGITSGGSLTGDQWMHIAVVGNGAGSIRVYNNGILVATQNFPYNFTGNTIVINGYFSTGFVNTGQIDDVRYDVGIAQYTSNFTPPTAALPVPTVVVPSLAEFSSIDYIFESFTAPSATIGVTLKTNGEIVPANNPAFDLSFTDMDSTGVRFMGQYVISQWLAALAPAGTDWWVEMTLDLGPALSGPTGRVRLNVDRTWTVFSNGSGTRTRGFLRFYTSSITTTVSLTINSTFEFTSFAT